MTKLTPDTAFSRAAARCARREYCRADWRRKFIEGGLTVAEAEETLRRLEAEGYIDEGRYARAFVHDKAAYDRWGRVKIVNALRLKGIEASDIDEALSGLPAEAYRQTLVDLLHQKARSLSATDPYERRQKLVRFAASRGFEADLVFSVIDTIE